MASNPEPFDDPDISDEEGLLRPIDVHLWVVPDGAGGTRPSSGGLQAIPMEGITGMSVYLESILAAAGLGPEAVLEIFTHHNLIRLTAGLVRAEGLGVMPAPNDQPKIGRAHANVVRPTFREGNAGKFTGGTKNRLARAAERIVWH